MSWGWYGLNFRAEGDKNIEERRQQEERDGTRMGWGTRARLVRATALLDDATELLELALGAEERAKALLRQLARLLVLCNMSDKLVNTV